MRTIETANKAYEKLVDDVPLVSLDIPVPKVGMTNKRGYKIRRLADPHIRSKKIKRHVYYYYCRGIDREIYLGDADAILRAVKGNKK